MFSNELLSVLFGLLSALSWGTGDFSGGLATRRANVYTVVIVSQMVGAALLLLWALATAASWPPPSDLLWSGAAGLAGAVGLLALYQGLARGQMGVVAPVTAVIAAILPVIYGLFTLGLPGVPQQIGFLLALVVVWLISREQTAVPFATADLRLAAVAGMGFGLFFIIMERGSATAVLWPLVVARLTSISTLFGAALLLRQGQRPTCTQLPLIAFAGIFDSSGNAFFALAARAGRVDVAAVLASLYPAATILLARLVLQEQMRRRQWVGVVLALTAVALIAL